MSIEILRLDASCPEERIEKIALLEEKNFSAPWTGDMLRRALARQDHLFFAAVCGGELAGYIGAQMIIDELEIFNVCVDEAYRRCGLGRELVRRLSKAAVEAGAVRIMLEVRAGNHPAIALYEAEGFVQVGRRKNYYQAPREDALLMDCIL